MVKILSSVTRSSNYSSLCTFLCFLLCLKIMFSRSQTFLNLMVMSLLSLTLALPQHFFYHCNGMVLENNVL